MNNNNGVVKSQEKRKAGVKRFELSMQVLETCSFPLAYTPAFEIHYFFYLILGADPQESHQSNVSFTTIQRITLFI